MGKKERKVAEYYVVSPIIRAQAVQAAMNKAVNHKKILYLIGAKERVKALMMEVKQNKKKLRRKRRLYKQKLPNKKLYTLVTHIWCAPFWALDIPVTLIPANRC